MLYSHSSINIAQHCLHFIESVSQRTKDSLDNLERLLGHLKEKTVRYSALMQDQGEKIETVAGEVRKLASKNETRALARELESQKATVQLCARAAVVDLVSSAALLDICWCLCLWCINTIWKSMHLYFYQYLRVSVSNCQWKCVPVDNTFNANQMVALLLISSNNQSHSISLQIYNHPPSDWKHPTIFLSRSRIGWSMWIYRW